MVSREGWGNMKRVMHSHAERTSKSQASLRPFVMLAAALAALHLIIISTSEGGWSTASTGAGGFMHDHLIQLHSRKVGSYIKSGKLDDAITSYCRAHALLELSDKQRVGAAAGGASSAAKQQQQQQQQPPPPPQARGRPGQLSAASLRSGTAVLLHNSGYAEHFLVRKLEEAMVPKAGKLVMGGHVRALKNLRAQLKGEPLLADANDGATGGAAAAARNGGGGGGSSSASASRPNAAETAADGEKDKDEL